MSFGNAPAAPTVGSGSEDPSALPVNGSRFLPTIADLSAAMSHRFPYSRSLLYEAFASQSQVDHDWYICAGSIGPGKKSEEPILVKNMRLSTTVPVNVAAQDASIALIGFEIDDSVGRALTRGLPKAETDINPVTGEPVEIKLRLEYEEIQQLQRKLTKKRDLELNRLYARFLRCPGDERLDRYVPRSLHTPKPSRVKIELRRAIAEKVAVAIKEARLEVFGKYVAQGELKDMMERFEKITSGYSANERFVSKLLAETNESKVAAADHRSLRKLARGDSDAHIHDEIARKITETQNRVSKVRHTKKCEEEQAKINLRAEEGKTAREEIKQVKKDLKNAEKERNAENQSPSRKHIRNASVNSAR